MRGDASHNPTRVAAVLRCARDSGRRPANRGALCQRTAMMTRRTTWHFVTFILHGSLQRMRRFLNEYWRSVLSNGIFMTAVAQNVDALEAISERQVSTGRRLRGMTSLQQGLATICCCHVVHNRPVEAQVRDDLEELVKVDWLYDVAVHSELVGVDQIPVLRA